MTCKNGVCTIDKKFPVAHLQAIKDAVNDNVITCEAARALAESLGVSYAEMGEMINMLGVKVRKCGLGCF